MLFTIICRDKPQSLNLRTKTRLAHVSFLEEMGDKLKTAGPFIDEAGQPNGSLLIVEADDLAAAKQLATQDPYALAGLFQSVEVRAWKWAFKAPQGV